MGDQDQEMNKIAELYPHSIELARGAKGGYQWTIKVRFPPEMTDPVTMSGKLKAIDIELRKEYGTGGSQ